jgi:hypothetical protein
MSRRGLAGTGGEETDPSLTGCKARDSSTMMQRFGMAIGAGLAAALLFAVVAKGTLLAMALACLAPLPIVIVTLGWGLDMGALAAVVAGAVAAGMIDPLSGVIFFCSVALPGWVLSALAMLRRDWLFSNEAANGERPWFPIGGLVAVAALFGALVGAAELAALIIPYGGYQRGVEAFAEELVPSLTEAVDGVVTLPEGLSIKDLAAFFTRLLPAALATASTMMFCINLYAGARAVQLSQRLRRPWRDLPEALVLPPPLGGVLVLCGILAVATHGAVAHVAWIFLGPLACVYVMQGLAVIHALSRRLPARIPMLIILYLVAWMFSPVSAPLLAALGLAESLLSLRARRAPAASAKS